MVKSFLREKLGFFFLIRGENTCCWEKFRTAVGGEAEWKERIRIESTGGEKAATDAPKGRLSSLEKERWSTKAFRWERS